MRYFIPVVRLSSELPPQQQPEDKLGGVPWGFPKQAWPLCEECGKPQSLLAQFLHHPLRLNLGRPGRILSVFQCEHAPGMCETWSAISGANAVCITEPEEIESGFTPLPSTGIVQNLEVRIVEWLEREVPDGLAFENSGFDPAMTRLGGKPSWIQGEDEAPDESWQFVGQLDSLYSFFAEPGAEVQSLAVDPKRLEGRTHICFGANFGDMGIGYIFIRVDHGFPEGWFFWQCY